MSWFAVKALGLQRWAWLLIAAVALIGGWRLIVTAEDADDQRNQEIGRQIQREDDLRETLERTEQANEARDDIRNDRNTARYDQCLRTARTPENCKRLLPERETPVSGD